MIKMQPKINLEQVLYNYQHDSFVKIQLSCQHEYYKERICKDVVLELTQTSKLLLQERKIYFKQMGNSLLIGQNKTKLKGLKKKLPLVVIQVKVVNPRFWLVTDFNAMDKNYVPFKSNLPLIMRCSDSAFILEKNHDIYSALEKQHQELANLSKTTFCILLTDINKITLDTQEIPLKLKARAVKLRYIITPLATKANSSKKLNIEEVLVKQKALIEFRNKKKTGLKLNVTPKENSYILESENDWLLRQENISQNANFFKFEVDVKENKKAKEGKAEIFLPFPNRLTPSLFKKENGNVIVEQNVNLLRFRAKPSPKK